MPATGTRLSAPQRREQLLDTARAIVARDGFHAISIEAIAREAGVTRPIVYDHFGDLPGVLEALVQREGARALRQLAAVLPTDLGGAARAREQLLAALRGYLDAVTSDPVTWCLVLMPPEGAPASLRDGIAGARTAIVAQLAEAVRPGVGAGRVSPDPELTARTMSAFADECARLALTDPDHFGLDRLVDHAAWMIGLVAS
ncbi:MAG TPA: TetR/AcrR family transcriptional regulator [Solirubrobacteraceae bacterium]|jgi:AcrR family transcriptional regulator|nr:TetR/AcrR family transcriptional regulator [Solirubrobacteraceae bacterium]